MNLNGNGAMAYQGQQPYQGQPPYQGQSPYQGQNANQGYNPYQYATRSNVKFPVDNDATVGMYDAEATIGVFDKRTDFIEFDIYFEGVSRKVRRDLREDIILGRGNAGVDIVLGSKSQDAKRISRTHAMITSQPDGIYIRDNYKNKTYLNGNEVLGDTLLHNNDVIQMGNATVKIFFSR